MKKLLVLTALCAGTILFAAPDTATADHARRGSGGFGYGSDRGLGYGGFGGIRSTPYGFGSDYCPHDSYYGHRYIDPYHGVRLRNRAHNRYDFLLRSGNFGFYYGR